MGPSPGDSRRSSPSGGRGSSPSGDRAHAEPAARLGEEDGSQVSEVEGAHAGLDLDEPLGRDDRLSTAVKGLGHGPAELWAHGRERAQDDAQVALDQAAAAKLHPSGGATRRIREFELDHLRQNLGHAADGGSAWAGGAVLAAAVQCQAGTGGAALLWEATRLSGPRSSNGETPSRADFSPRRRLARRVCMLELWREGHRGEVLGSGDASAGVYSLALH